MSDASEVEKNGAFERCRQLEGEVGRLNHELDEARLAIAELKARNEQLEDAYLQCKHLYTFMTDQEFTPLTREALNEMEQSGLTLEKIIEELETEHGSQK